MIVEDKSMVVALVIRNNLTQSHKGHKAKVDHELEVREGEKTRSKR